MVILKNTNDFLTVFHVLSQKFLFQNINLAWAPQFIMKNRLFFLHLVGDKKKINLLKKYVIFALFAFNITPE